MYRFAIIGGGFGGLVSAIKLKDFILFEKSKTLGGCGGYFIRNNLAFNSGATTIAFMGKNEFVYKFFENFGIKLNFKEHNSAFDIIDIQNDKILNFKEIITSNEKIFEKIYHNPLMLMKFLFDFLKVSNLNEYEKNSLIISLQSSKAPFEIFKKLSYDYYFSTWAIFKEGFRNLIESIEERIIESGEILKECEVVKIKKLSNYFEIETTNGIYKAKNLVLNLDPWNVNRILGKNLLKLPNENNLWHALVLYLTWKVKPLKNYYYLILDRDLKTIHAPFVSFFENGTITISSHYKNYYNDKEIDSLLNVLKSMNIEFQLITIANSKSFEKYTGRYKGYVGGFEISYMNLIKAFFRGLSKEGIYFMGDYYFPGQSLSSAIIRAKWLL